MFSKDGTYLPKASAPMTSMLLDILHHRAFTAALSLLLRLMSATLFLAHLPGQFWSWCLNDVRSGVTPTGTVAKPRPLTQIGRERLIRGSPTGRIWQTNFERFMLVCQLQVPPGDKLYILNMKCHAYVLFVLRSQRSQNYPFPDHIP